MGNWARRYTPWLIRSTVPRRAIITSAMRLTPHSRACAVVK
jgi:hypothetical protein